MGAPCGCDVIRSKTIVPATAEHPTPAARALFFGGSGVRGQTFADPRLAAAVVDRLTFRAHIIETGSDSYRLRLTRSAKGGASGK